MTQPAYKICPRCQMQTSVAATVCGRCGHQYQIQFSPTDQPQIVVPPPVYPQQPPPYYQPPPQHYYQQPLHYQQPPPGYQQQPVQQKKQNTSGYAIGAVVLALLSLIIAPPIFGAGAILCGREVKKGGNKALGIGLMVMSGFFALVGVLIGLMLVTRH